MSRVRDPSRVLWLALFRSDTRHALDHQLHGLLVRQPLSGQRPPGLEPDGMPDSCAPETGAGRSRPAGLQDRDQGWRKRGAARAEFRWNYVDVAEKVRPHPLSRAVVGVELAEGRAEPESGISDGGPAPKVRRRVRGEPVCA